MDGFGTFYRVRTVFQGGDVRYESDAHRFKLFGIDWTVEVALAKDAMISVTLRTRSDVTCDVVVSLFINDDRTPSLRNDIDAHAFTVAEPGRRCLLRPLRALLELKMPSRVVVSALTIEFDFRRFVDVYNGLPRTIYDRSVDILEVNNCGLSDLAALVAADVSDLCKSLYAADYSKNCRIVLGGREASDPYIRIHSAVLQASSSVYSWIPLSRAANADVHADNPCRSDLDTVIRVEVQGVSFESMMTFVQYLYGLLNLQDIFNHKRDLILIDQYLSVRGLLSLCLSFYRFDMSVGNVLDRLQFADDYRLHHLREACFDFLLLKVRDVDGFQEFCIRTTFEMREDLSVLFKDDEEVLALIAEAVVPDGAV